MRFHQSDKLLGMIIKKNPNAINLIYQNGNWMSQCVILHCSWFWPNDDTELSSGGNFYLFTVQEL